ncbi:amidohydrolase family protein [Pediococcus damnosus]|nr:amidohydrolase family protein [Pediococcus damnosus]
MMRKIITVEEHYEIPAPATKGNFKTQVNAKGENPSAVTQLLTDFDQKLKYMDKYGITMQVISNAGHSPKLLDDVKESIAGCRKSNDFLAEQVKKHPDRFAGLAVLPVGDPDAAAEELKRSINELGLSGALIAGVPNGHFLDEPQYLPIFAEAEELNVPLYLHPGMISKAERDLLYKSPSYSDKLGDMIGLAGWGWHIESGTQMIRLIASGLFDKYPNLHLVSGHWGENVPNFLERLDEFTGMVHPPLDRKFSDYYRDNVYVTASGMFTEPQMTLALSEMGPDHVLWAEDFPFLQRKEQVADFLENAKIDEETKDKISHQNSEKLFNLK